MNAAQNQRPSPGELVLDHVSHFVPDLEAAAGWLQRLGFVVTPRSEQRTPEGPVGAANRCVMLEEGYLEFLAPTLDTPAAARMRAALSRFVGVHLACFGTPDAEAEHRRLATHGFEPQPLVDLRRTVDEGEVRFRVVRPAPERMPEGRIQYVEQMTPEALWTARNLAHANGVTGLKALYVVADEAPACAARWAHFSGLLPRRQGPLVRLDCARGTVWIGAPAALEPLLGPVPPAPALAGYALACRDPRALL
ncbi:MAG TPA: VOC family protein, partial [Burkholderiales bacterium]|nr:VOC family protein [Burkholderiales bacterium]